MASPVLLDHQQLVAASVVSAAACDLRLRRVLVIFAVQVAVMQKLDAVKALCQGSGRESCLQGAVLVALIPIIGAFAPKKVCDRVSMQVKHSRAPNIDKHGRALDDVVPRGVRLIRAAPAVRHLSPFMIRHGGVPNECAGRRSIDPRNER